MEWSTIHDDVCVLTITGTAATVRGLPDLAQAQRMWAEWELHQSVAIDDGIGEEHGGIGIGIGPISDTGYPKKRSDSGS